MSYKGWHNKETYLAYLYLTDDSYDWVSYAEKVHLLDLTSAIIDEICSLVDWIAKYDDDLYWEIVDYLDATIDWEELAEAFQVLADKQAKEHEEKTFAEYLMSLSEEEEEEMWEDEEDFAEYLMSLSEEEEKEIWEDEED